MKALVRVDSKGRVTIPLHMREAVGIRPDTYVSLELDEATGVIVLKPSGSADEFLADFEVVMDSPKDIEELIKAVLEEGGEVRYLRCYKDVESLSRCEVTVSVLDAKATHYLKEKLNSIGFKVVKAQPVARRFG